MPDRQLMGKEDVSPPSRKTPTENTAGKSPPEVAPSAFTQVTLHRQSAGRAGRTVTMVAIKPPQSPAALEALAKTLRRALGCGSHVEQDRIVLQGDIPDRAQEWFVKKGARKVVRGN
ncbi:MAG: translation initiation factor [Synergistaceae bacterium]|nr:translation initiation factor [Synergistaceae bacterium]